MAQADPVQKLVGEYGAAAKAKLANPASIGQPEDQLLNGPRVPFGYWEAKEENNALGTSWDGPKRIGTIAEQFRFGVSGLREERLGI